MSQRSFSNERYRKDAKIGSTRKSASSAKPIRKQGTAESSVKSSSSKSSSSKASSAKGSSKERPKPKDGIERDWSGLPTSPQIKKWRRVWWVLLLSGLAIIGMTYVVPEFRNNNEVARITSFIVLALSMVAVSIDLVIIRKLRKELMAAAEKKSAKKSGKADKGDPSGKANAKGDAGGKADATPATSDNETLAKKAGKDAS